MNRRYRLTDGERLQQVRREGASQAHPLIVLCWLPNGQPVSRCAFVVSRRIGKAVVRNRARRRMREAVRLMWDAVQPGWDLVWIARTAIVKAEFVELQAACLRLLRGARLLAATGPSVHQPVPSQIAGRS